MEPVTNAIMSVIFFTVPIGGGREVPFVLIWLLAGALIFTLYNRFVRWAAKGVWTDIFHALSSAGGPPAEVLIDSSAVKAHRCASGGKGGN